MALFLMACEFSRLINLVQQRQEVILFLHHVRERFANQFIPGFVEQTTERGIDVPHDVKRTLYTGQWQLVSARR